MCPNDSRGDSPPPPYHMVDCMFDSEEGSDVTFLVGVEPETWRFPGHRAVLSKSNAVFKAMLSRPESVITIQDVNGRAFDLLLRHLYKEDVCLQSVNTALCTLYASMKYMCSGLMTICVNYLNDNITTSNVLEIYQHARLYSRQTSTSNFGAEDPFAASAPPYDLVCLNREPDGCEAEQMITLCSNLLENCLLFIDRKADAVFSDESIEDLCAESFKELAERDTLNLTSECILYSALEKWCNRECKRRQLEMSLENKRSVIDDDLLFTVRYLLMSKEEFYRGPMSGDLLRRDENTALTGYIMHVKNDKTVLSDSVLSKISRPRTGPVSKNKNSSFKSTPSTSSTNDQDSASSKSKKKAKKKDSSESPKKACSASCIGDCFIRAIACIFD